MVRRYGFEDFEDDADQLHALIADRGRPAARLDPAALILPAGSTCLVTGSSTGIGLAVCLKLARDGHTVFASMRGPLSRSEALQLAATARREQLAIELIELDVTDSASREVRGHNHQQTYSCLGAPLTARWSLLALLGRFISTRRQCSRC